MACTCSRHAVNPDCPKHGYLTAFRVIRASQPSVLDDPAWQKADRERWDRREAQEGAR